MRWIFLTLWNIICIPGIIFDVLFFSIAWVFMQLWEFKYHKFTWNYWTEQEVLLERQGTWNLYWKSDDYTPWDTYKRWITFSNE